MFQNIGADVPGIARVFLAPFTAAELDPLALRHVQWIETKVQFGISGVDLVTREYLTIRS